MGIEFIRVIAIMTLLLTCTGSAVKAASFMDWWLTPDQQGRYFFERKNFEKAARSFTDRKWKAIAFYKAGDYSNSAALFETMETAEDMLYLGNSLARQNKLAPAIDAYKKALELNPEFSEAKFNLDWVEGLLKLDEKEYDDAGGTGGKLRADRIITDERGAKGKGEMSTQEVQAQTGLSDQQIQEMWMRRVQTTPGDFLRLKFSYQLNDQVNKNDQTEKKTQ